MSDLPGVNVAHAAQDLEHDAAELGLVELGCLVVARQIAASAELQDLNNIQRKVVTW